jgi:capsule polysaccharide export protein KpsE/RkpR
MEDMNLQVESETSAQTIARLQRELAHVQEQAQVAHAMAMSWKTRCLQAEAQVRRLQKTRDRQQRVSTPQGVTRAVGDGLHDSLALVDENLGDVHAPVSV